MTERDQWRVGRMKQIRRDGTLRRVEFPVCKAKVGEVCHTPAWHRCEAGHKDRRVLAGVA